MTFVFSYQSKYLTHAGLTGCFINIDSQNIIENVYLICIGLFASNSIKLDVIPLCTLLHTI